MQRPQNLLRLLVRPLEIFFHTEALGGTILILVALVALAWANSPLKDSYEALWATEVTIGARGAALSKPLLFWINDLLLAVFFLVVALEIKRELLVGELSSVRKAALPVIAALGGMLVPAALFLVVAHQPPASRGWGMPMATDIAFALGCLRLLGKRIPSGLVVFLAALAIIDDLGAILLIAIFYPTDLSFAALGVAGLFTLVLVGMNLLGVRRPALYVVAGLPLWAAILKSGVHPTVAGVIVGFCVPARARFSPDVVLSQARELLKYAERAKGEEAGSALRSLEHCLDQCESPLSRLEHGLHPWVALGIVPLFALANAGVSLAGASWADLTGPASLGVLLGLFIGKQVGIFGATFLAVNSRLGMLPTGVGWRHLYGISVLAGIGFTMSLFIAGLAYGDGTPLHWQAKIGILAASLISAVTGLAILAGSRRADAPQPRGTAK